MAGTALAQHAGSTPQLPALPRLEDARGLFEPHLPCSGAELRRIYLRLALSYHPDKCPAAEQVQAKELFQAIAAAYEELLQRVASGSRDAAAERRRVKTRVAAAAELGDLEELRRLLLEDAGCATQLDDLGVSPLMFAAAGGCLEAAQLLVDFGADIQAKNPINWTVLLYAALGNHARMVEWLVNAGAIVTDHDLILAAYTGNSSSLAALLQFFSGSVAELRTNESGKSLLHLACEGLCFLKSTAEQHAECIHLVLQQAVPVDQAEPRRGRTCLQNLVGDVRWRTRNFEASSAHLTAVERLCEAGASVVAEDAEGQSALSLAASNNLCKVREILFAYV